MKKNLVFLILFEVILSGYTLAQTTIGLIQHSIGSLDDGYVLFPPTGSTNSYLIDKCGREVKSWTSNYKPGHSAYLLNDGSLLRAGDANNSLFNAGGSGGVIEKFDWNGNLTWSYRVSDATKCQHHDIKALPNGNVLVIAWESKTDIDAISQGRNPALVPSTLWSEQILEIQPIGPDSGIVVWEWHLWDHLIQDFDMTKPNYGQINSQPHQININYKASATNRDWIHLNSIDYNPTLDQILLSSHSFNEIWIIDHSTSTSQAAGHTGGNSGMGGDILYRWGNPKAYNIGTTSQFFGQHNAHWIDSGLPYQNQIMVFNNGLGRPGGNYSTIEIINPPLTGFNYISALPFLPNAPSWIYNSGNPNNFYAVNISGAQQLSNGNVLFCNGPAGTFFEIDSSGTEVWKYINPVANSGVMTQGSAPAQNVVFRCSFYPDSYPGFTGHVLVANNTIENVNTVSGACNLFSAIDENLIDTTYSDLLLYPNPASKTLNIKVKNTAVSNSALSIINFLGEVMYEKSVSDFSSVAIDISQLKSGIYILQIWNEKGITNKKFVKE